MGEKPEIHTSSRYLVNPVRCSNGTVWSVNSESSNSMERANSPEVQDESTKLIRVLALRMSLSQRISSFALIQETILLCVRRIRMFKFKILIPPVSIRRKVQPRMWQDRYLRYLARILDSHVRFPWLATTRFVWIMTCGKWKMTVIMPLVMRYGGSRGGWDNYIYQYWGWP